MAARSYDSMGFTSRERWVKVKLVREAREGLTSCTRALISGGVRECVTSRVVRCMRCGGMSQRSV